MGYEEDEEEEADFAVEGADAGMDGVGEPVEGGYDGREEQEYAGQGQPAEREAGVAGRGGLRGSRGLRGGRSLTLAPLNGNTDLEGKREKRKKGKRGRWLRRGRGRRRQGASTSSSSGNGGRGGGR